MNEKREVKIGNYRCSGCKTEKQFKPSVIKVWSTALANYEYKFTYRCNECKREATQKWRRENPLKYKAHGAVFVALRNGFIKKEPCEICGELKVEAHHVDYEKPLDVIWYCKKHHVIADRLLHLQENI